MAPERNDPKSSQRDDSGRSGNGHATASTILVVEDEVLIRLSVADFLRGCGYRVLEAANGEEAQAIFSAAEPIEVLFSDIDLGDGINGFVLAAWVRQKHPDVRIVLASGARAMTDEAAGLCDGPLLDKPYSYSALADHITQLLAALGRRPG